MAEDEPRIFVDEDWKAQVQRERQEAASKEVQPPPQTMLPDDGEEALPGYPEPTFTGVVTNLAAQAMMAMGGMPGPNEGEVLVDLQQAQFCIEALGILRVKTKGNLTEAEAKHLEEVIRQLAQAYTMLMREFEAHAMREAGIDPTLRRP